MAEAPTGYMNKRITVQAAHGTAGAPPPRTLKVADLERPTLSLVARLMNCLPAASEDRQNPVHTALLRDLTIAAPTPPSRNRHAQAQKGTAAVCQPSPAFFAYKRVKAKFGQDHSSRRLIVTGQDVGGVKKLGVRLVTLSR